MGLYRHHIFPRLMEWVMAREELHRLHMELLAQVHSEVLELGIGTRLNRPHYPKTVAGLHAVDPADLLPKIVTERSAGQPFPVHIQHVTAESLPYVDRSFDFAVSTWTLCTILDPVKALREVRRVLKSDGVFLFLEHGRSEDESVAAWQDRLKIMTFDRLHMQNVPDSPARCTEEVQQHDETSLQAAR